MAISFSIDRLTQTVLVDRASMPLLSGTASEVRTFDTTEFHHLLRDNEDDAEGMHFATTHNWKDPLTIGGVTLASVLELLAPYSLTFEDALYTVYVQGSNNNLVERLNKNQVSVYSSNSAGLTDPLVMLNSLKIINQGVQKSSILIPHTTNLV